MNSRQRPGYGWNELNAPVSPAFTPEKLLNTVQSRSVGEVARHQGVEDERGTPIILPPHLFIPAGAQSLDLRVLADIAAGTVLPAEIMSFKAPKGAQVHFISYAVFSDGQLAANQQFIPKVENKIAFPYQGDPNDSFKINLGLAPDLSNNSLIQAQLTLQPEQIFSWSVINKNAVDISMGVRMVGYVDRGQMRRSTRSGG